MKQGESIKIFCSYAHEDRLFAQQLETHFALLKRLNPRVFWTHSEIRAGDEREQTIGEQLGTAQVILLLVGPDFINSQYCYTKEMKRAIERHERREAVVIPVLLRPFAFWKHAPFSKLQALPE
ncbi:MAG TPA: toll/interleukin-1 receptor domain-containing protein [Ktedonobacteraceae bacterium]